MTLLNQFLITTLQTWDTLSILQSQLLPHPHKTYKEYTSYPFRIILFGDENSIGNDSTFFLNDQLTYLSSSAFCLENSIETINLESMKFNFTYDTSCFILDKSMEGQPKLWMMSDIIGRSPLWYSFSHEESHLQNHPTFILSSDYLLAKLLLFEDMTSLNHGQIMSVDVFSFEIITITDKKQLLFEKGKFTSSEEVPELYQSIYSDILHIDNSTFLMEIDTSDSISLLSLCMLPSSLNPQLYFTEAITFSSSIHDIASWKQLANYLSTNSLIENLDFPQSIEKLAISRWKICARAATLGVPLMSIISSSSGITSNPYLIYFQNLFCKSLNVSVIYPFKGRNIISAFNSHSIDASSYVLRTFDYFSSSGNCSKKAVPFTPLKSTFNASNYNINDENLDRESEIVSIGRKYSHPTHGFIFLVLATNGYKEMLANFLCSALKFPSSRHLVILTSSEDKEIINIAKSMKIGFVLFKSSNKSSKSLDFGTLRYQKLILHRTRIANILLQKNFQPIIADIDTVWLRDPIEVVVLEMQRQEYDIMVTKDYKEICGCFIVLLNTSNAKSFWGNVTSTHELLIQNNANGLIKFDESEQKIITRLLLNREYDGNITALVLKASIFPSGYEYFSQTKRSEELSIIHNNFIIGYTMKIMRFMRYGYWYTNQHKFRQSDELVCRYQMNSNQHETIFEVLQNVNMPMVNIILPIHGISFNSQLNASNVSTASVISQVIVENMPLNTSFDFFIGEPFKYIPIESFGTFDLHISDNDNALDVIGRAVGMTVSRHGARFPYFSVDVAIDRQYFAIDRNGKYHYEANDRVLQYRLSSPQILTSAISYQNEVLFTNDTVVNSDLQFKIKILAFKRLYSLQRLLQSLLNADYMNTVIDMEIFVDGGRNSMEWTLVEEVIAFVSSFTWPFGKKSIVLRKENFGLKQQWFYAWNPVSEKELAFIFEDDVEVSPYFFKWAYHTAIVYYSSDMINLHHRLFTAMQNVDSIDKFLKDYAGIPLIYGICLQKQHLAPNHYPRKLKILNGYRPFLYSLIGSWGPLLFPIYWQSFRLWWIEKSNNKSYHPFTEQLITNDYYRRNPNIWTPWFIRFAFETGGKCLYSNLPLNLSLIANHQEEGENYKFWQGSDTKLLEFPIDRNVYSASIYKGIISALNYIPSIYEIASFQYDFNLRRAGNFASEKLLTIGVSNPLNEKYPFIKTYVQFMHDSIRLAFIDDFNISVDHWVYVADIIETILLPNSNILFIGSNPLMLLLKSQPYNSSMLTFHSECLKNYTPENYTYFTIKSIAESDFQPSLIVMNVFQFSEKSSMSFLFTRLTTQLEYILILGPCSNVPSSLRVKDHDELKFGIVEALCQESDVDVGFVLYRRDFLPNLAISKRYEEGLTLRSYLKYDF